MSSKQETTTLTVSDDLHLSDVNVPEIPKDIIFPDELNRYLRDQVQYLTHQNGMLYKNLSEAEAQVKESSSKINNLNTQLEEYQQMCSKNNLSGSTTNLASSKIVELSKKLRERNSEIEIYKTKCSKLQQYILSMEKENNAKQVVVEPEKPKNELEEQIRILQEKLNSTNTKLCEALNSNTQLKTDLKLANKLLQQEVGDNFENLKVVVNANSNWRGRAQIICDLQQKNNNLREKLKTYQERDKGIRNNTGVISHEAPIQTKWDKRLENLTRENVELKNTIQDVKRKTEAVKARNKVLESEYAMLKAKLTAGAEQNEHDREIIASLTTKVSQSHEIQNEQVRQKHAIIQKVEQANKELQLEVSKQSCKLNNLNAIIEEKNREIESLRKKARNQPELTPRNTPIVDTQTVKMLETERLRLLELTKTLNERLESERKILVDTEMKHRAERQRAAKLEAKVARLKLTQPDESSDNYSTYSLKNREDENRTENRLELMEETVKALQTRLELERQEHKNDIDEFSKILKNYGYIQSVLNTD